MIGKVEFAGHTEKETTAAQAQREGLIEDWKMLVQFCTDSPALDPVEDLQRKFLSKKAGKDGLDYTPLDRVLKFRRAELLDWLKRAIAEAKKETWFDQTQFDEFVKTYKAGGL